MTRKTAQKKTQPQKRSGIGETFWKEMRAANRPLLALDFDGTLVAHHRDRMAARLPPPVRETLERILARGRTRVVVVTGRVSSQASMLMGGLKVEIVGEHGWERMTPSGKMKRSPVEEAHRTALQQAEERSRKRGLAHRVERKRTSVALHTRGLSPSQARLLQCVAIADWTPLCAGSGLQCLRFDGGVELRSSTHTKGTAVESILAGHRKHDLVVYVGNDRTDEDAMRAIKERGHPMAVGEIVPDELAVHRFPGPEAVAEFLARWDKEEAATAARAPAKAKAVAKGAHRPAKPAKAAKPAPKEAGPAGGSGASKAQGTARKQPARKRQVPARKSAERS